MMAPARQLLLTLLLVITVTTTAFALPTDVSGKPSAASLLKRLASVFSAADGYQSTSHIRIFALAGGDLASEFDANTTVERPNKVSIVTTQDSHVGVLMLADGTDLTVFNAAKLSYVATTSGATFHDLLLSTQKAAKALLAPGQIGQLQLSLTLPSMFVDGTSTIALRPPAVSSQETTAMALYNGKRVYQVVQSMVYPNKGRVDYAFLIDPVTDLPLSFSEYAVRPSGSYVPLIRQDFSKFVVLKSPLPPSGYVFAPPPGSTQVTDD